MRKTLIPCMLMLTLALPLAAGIGWASKASPATEEVAQAEATTHYLSDMDLSKGTCGDGRSPKKNLATEGTALTVRGTVYDNGVGVHAESKFIVKLNGATAFHTLVGIDDKAKQQADHGHADYAIIGVDADKNQTTLQSGTIDRNDAAPATIDIADLSAYEYLILNVTKGSDNQIWADHVDWINTTFTGEAAEAPVTVTESEMNAGKENVKVYPPTAPSKPGMGEMDLLTELGGFDNITTGWAGHPAQVDVSIDGNPLTLKDTVYASGVGAHATSQIVVQLNGASWFVARLGIDDEVAKGGNCTYSIVGKGGGKPETTLQSGTITMNDTESVKIDVKCEGFKYLVLTADANGGNEGDHVDWVNAYFERSGNNDVAPVIVSPDVFNASLACATQMFSQPGVRFMHKLKTGNPDAILTVSGLPEGLTYNEERQLVEGIVETEGDYTYIVGIQNEEGEEPVEETITLTVSGELQQPTPFMGWLSWNALEGNVSEDKVIDAAKAFVDLGLKDAGYRYICMDDKWHASGRAADGKPQFDANKFPNGFNYLTKAVHDMDMKIGIYSDAAGSTCGGMFGSYGYETIDANQYAEWGFDLLKYDACGTPGDMAGASARYKAMGDALKASGRDILFYICEWGQRDPWKWGPDAGGTCWRISYDTRDIWDHGRHDGGHCGTIQVIDIMKNIGYYAGVNRFNDGDMMMIGLWGTGKSSNNDTKGNYMNATEYQSQFSMWCMFASPLTISNDPRFWNDDAALSNSGINAEGQKRIRDNKENDLNILKNEEMIAINQDRMGQSALLMKTEQDGDIEIYMKDLENGDIAVAVLNRGDATHNVTLDLTEYYLKADKKYNVRDLWAHKEIANGVNGFSCSVASHETKVYRISKKTTSTGIASAEAQAPVSVKVQANGVQVTAPGTAGQAKRILVSTLSGQVVATATGADETITLPVNAPKGMYVVNTVCNGIATSTKVKF